MVVFYCINEIYYNHVKISLTERNALFDLLDDKVFTSESESVYSFDAPSFSPIASPDQLMSGGASTPERGCIFILL